MFQPNREPHDPYLRREDLQNLVGQLCARHLGRSRFYDWLHLLEESASDRYSNYVAAQFLKYGELLNQRGSSLDAQAALRSYLAEFETETEFICEVFREVKRCQKPRLVWVFSTRPNRHSPRTAIIDI